MGRPPHKKILRKTSGEHRIYLLVFFVSYNLNTDSVFRLMKAYHKVRMYRTDVQGVCDSLVYNSKDSCMTMYTDPILWNEGQQLLGEQIKIYMNDSTIDWAHIINQALTVEMKDSIHYNQVSGKEMKAYFINGDMRHIEVIGNVLTAFYPEEKDSTMTGFNCLEGSVLHLYMKDKKMEKPDRFRYCSVVMILAPFLIFVCIIPGVSADCKPLRASCFSGRIGPKRGEAYD